MILSEQLLCVDAPPLQYQMAAGQSVYDLFLFLSLGIASFKLILKRPMVIGPCPG